MKNSDLPIYPSILRQIADNEFRIATEKDQREGIYLSSNLGITKREHFANTAMQGLLASVPSDQKSLILYIEMLQRTYGNIPINQAIAKEAVTLADYLLAELNAE